SRLRSFRAHVARDLRWRAPFSRSRPGRLHFQPAVDRHPKLLEYVASLARIGRARLEAAQGLGEPFKIALGVLPDAIERWRRPQAAGGLHYELHERGGSSPPP